MSGIKRVTYLHKGPFHAMYALKPTLCVTGQSPVTEKTHGIV